MVDVDPARISIEKCWSLGLVLQVDPLELFVVSRPVIDQRFMDAAERSKLFPVKSLEPGALSALLRQQRTAMGYGLRELAAKLPRNPAATYPISAGFLSQLETNFRGLSSVVSGEKLWALGVMLGIDPLALYVMSRGLNPHLLDYSFRRSNFGI